MDFVELARCKWILTQYFHSVKKTPRVYWFLCERACSCYCCNEMVIFKHAFWGNCRACISYQVLTMLQIARWLESRFEFCRLQTYMLLALVIHAHIHSTWATWVRTTVDGTPLSQNCTRWVNCMWGSVSDVTCIVDVAIPTVAVVCTLHNLIKLKNYHTCYYYTLATCALLLKNNECLENNFWYEENWS